ncbi:MAG: PF20097 family protein [bacterium]|nr:PF20097 family protein [bacterium]
METKKCSKCQGEMEEGIIPTYSLGAIPPSFWVKKISFIKGLENKHNIIAYRCKSCGFLESYAK